MKMALGNSGEARNPEGRALSGPDYAFALAIVAALIVFLATRHLLSVDAALPLVAAFLFVAAGITGVLALIDAGPPAHGRQVTFLDATGALVLIGIGVAALVEPEQVAGLVETANRKD